MEGLTRHLLKKLDYNQTANLWVIESILANRSKINDRVHTLFSHVLTAHHLWNYRVLELKPLFGVWEVIAAERFIAINGENYEQTHMLLESRPIDDVTEYCNSKGEVFSSSLEDIITHVINHSTYHRAQVATEMKNCGLAAVPTDYIHWVRTT